MLPSAQRKMLRLIIHTKRKYKKTAKHKVKNSEDKNDIDSSCIGDESEDGQSSNETENLTESRATTSIKIGSTQQKTAEDGLHSKKTTQRIQLREREEIRITDQRGTSMV